MSREEEEEDYVIVKTPDARWAKPTHQGWMSKFTVTMGKICWRNRFFILNEDGKLFYFKGDNKKNPCKKPIVVKGKRFRESNVRIFSIEIEREGKPFLFYCEEFSKFDKWMKNLEEVGGLRDLPLKDDGDDGLYSKKFSSDISSFRRKEKKRREGGGGGLFDSPLCTDSCDEEIAVTDPNRKKGPLVIKKEYKHLFNIPYNLIKGIKISRVSHDGTYVYDASLLQQQREEGEEKVNEKPVTIYLYETKDFINNEERFEQFIKSITILRKLKPHPGIPEFLGATIGTPLNEPYIGYLTNPVTINTDEENNHPTENKKHHTTVKDFVTKDKMSFPQKIEISKLVCDTMIYLHDQNVIHSDLRWENVLLDDHYLPKLAGFSQLTELDPSIGEKDGVSMEKYTKLSSGRDIYVSPEVTISSTYGYPADIYSFGVMMYTIFTEDFHPYGKEITFNIEIKVSLNSDFRPPIDKNESLCKYYPMLVHTMKRCWDVDVKNRPSWKEIKYGLENNEKMVSDGKESEKEEEMEGEDDEE